MLGVGSWRMLRAGMWGWSGRVGGVGNDAGGSLARRDPWGGWVTGRVRASLLERPYKMSESCSVPRGSRNWIRAAGHVRG